MCTGHRAAAFADLATCRKRPGRPQTLSLPPQEVSAALDPSPPPEVSRAHAVGLEPADPASAQASRGDFQGARASPELAVLTDLLMTGAAGPGPAGCQCPHKGQFPVPVPRPPALFARRRPGSARTPPRGFVLVFDCVSAHGGKLSGGRNSETGPVGRSHLLPRGKEEGIARCRGGGGLRAC